MILESRIRSTVEQAEKAWPNLTYSQRTMVKLAKYTNRDLIANVICVNALNILTHLELADKEGGKPQ